MLEPEPAYEKAAASQAVRRRLAEAKARRQHEALQTELGGVIKKSKKSDDSVTSHSQVSDRKLAELGFEW